MILLCRNEKSCRCVWQENLWEVNKNLVFLLLPFLQNPWLFLNPCDYRCDFFSDNKRKTHTTAFWPSHFLQKPQIWKKTNPQFSNTSQGTILTWILTTCGFRLLFPTDRRRTYCPMSSQSLSHYIVNKPLAGKMWCSSDQQEEEGTLNYMPLGRIKVFTMHRHITVWQPGKRQPMHRVKPLSRRTVYFSRLWILAEGCCWTITSTQVS